MAKTAPNWTKTGTIVGYAEWLRKASGALAVVVVRVDDSALAADPRLAPADAGDVIAGHLPGLVANLAAARRDGKLGARVELGPLDE